MTYFRQIYDEGLAQAAYIIGDAATRTAVVVDPLRDIDVYLDHIASRGYRLVGVMETHIHADFLSGGREMAHATGAPLYVSGETVSGWEYAGLDGLEVVEMSDGDTLELGTIEIEAMHTPGHTPEHLCFLVTDTAQSDEPMMVLTGDFVFVGDLGRPDLLEEAAGEMGTAEPGARQLFDAMEEKFLDLPDFVEIWPGHGSGSACGKALGDVPSTAVGYEKRSAWWTPYFETGDKSAFVHEFLRDQPESPTYFRQMKRLNRDGPKILGEMPFPPRLMPGRVQRLLDDGAMVFDLRDVHAFSRGHLPGAINLSVMYQVSNYAGWIAPYDKTLVLVCEPHKVEEATRRLIRIGLDDIAGFVPSDRLGQYAPQDLASYPVVSDPDEVHQHWKSGDVRIVDARSEGEYKKGHIPDALHVHYGQIAEHVDEVPTDETLVVHCEAGARAAVAASHLRASGFDDVVVYTGGFGGWKKKGHPVED